ncbi:MAG TPA: phosphoadenosine phosphosulfate reductase family protein, partial [Methanotrichaceae archaeon]|nr:phosphoadenosine phosphosulfate reductase family protein [Methanotrichaceae archaeon]
MQRIYTGKNVLEAAQDRMAFIFDTFENIYVSVSGGKDSTALYHLALEEAIKRDRKINLFYLDQEVEYAATINTMRGMMAHPNVVPMWYQVPIYMTNSTSYEEDMLYAWAEGAEWLRPKENIAIKHIDGIYPQRFYKFFNWFEAWQPEGSAFLVGLRAEEGITRYRAVTKYPGYKDIKWSTKSSNPKSFKLYPI